MGYEGDGWLEDKNWFRRHWAISIFLGLFLIGIIGIITEDDDSGMTGNVVDTQDYDLEIDIYELLDEFDVLTKLQQEEKVEELKGKRIKTSTTAYKITKASLSTQYVVMDDDYFNPSVKAFFLAEEKDRLLKVDIGDEITFIGELVTYKEGIYTSSYVEFTKSKLVD